MKHSPSGISKRLILGLHLGVLSVIQIYSLFSAAAKSIQVKISNDSDSVCIGLHVYDN
jgi:hypothetical protein